MVAGPFEAALCQKTILADFISTVNHKEGTLIELALARPGTSMFTRAVYVEALNEANLKRFVSVTENISFVNGICKEQIGPLNLNDLNIRKGADRYIKSKNIISFDVDFKDNVAGYHGGLRETLLPKIFLKLKQCFSENNIRPWMMVYSGNGIHIHFRLSDPYELSSISEYVRIYVAIKEHFEAVSGLIFDSACCNPSRLMRLPFSMNRKDRNDPIRCEVLWHDSNADFSKMFRCFESYKSSKASDKKHEQDKEIILANLDLIKILNHFGYSKHGSISEKSSHILCSSPFKTDSNPSFYYEPKRKIFYDFSAGLGGDLFVLIGKLANIDTKTNFYEVLQRAAAIAGVTRQKEMGRPNILSRPKAGFDLVSIGDLLQEPEETIEWLVDDFLPLGGTSLICGKPKVGKTTLVRLLALCVATGERFLGRFVTKGKVIYLALEEKRSQVRLHFEEMGAKGDEEIFIHASAAPLEQTLEQLNEIVKKYRPALVIVDTLFRLIRVRDVSDYAAINNALEPLNTMARESNTHFLLVHHMGKQEREGADGVLGSTAISGLVDAIVMIRRKNEVRTLRSQQRYGTDLEESILDFDPVTRTSSIGDLVDIITGSDVSDKILIYLQKSGPTTEAELRKNISVRNELKVHALRQLVAAGQVLRSGRGGKSDPYRFCLPEHLDVPNVPGSMWEPGNKNADVQIDGIRTPVEEGEL